VKDNFLGSNPIIPVKSVVETANFYKNQLSFSIDILWENPSYGVVSRGNTVIEFGEGRAKNSPVAASVSYLLKMLTQFTTNGN